MQITYKDRRIEKVCTDPGIARKTYGTEMAIKIEMRVTQIAEADSAQDMIQNKVGRCHALVGNRKGQYAMDLVHPYRLIFTTHGNQIHVARIEEIVDYH